MDIAIIANGHIFNDKLILEKIKDYNYIIAADGGATHALRLGIIPDLIMGDFDSISSEAMQEFSNVQKIAFLKDKDETDLELAILKAFSLNPKKVGLFAATGNRTDHTLVNLYLLTRFGLKLHIESENETIFVLNSEKTFKINTEPMQTISLLPLGPEASGVTTKGLKWELDNSTLNKNFLSISNNCLETSFEISIKKGELLCFLTKKFKSSLNS
jgi:thiamine pyrophosphokinase